MVPTGFHLSADLYSKLDSNGVGVMIPNRALEYSQTNRLNVRTAYKSTNGLRRVQAKLAQWISKRVHILNVEAQLGGSEVSGLVTQHTHTHTHTNPKHTTPQNSTHRGPAMLNGYTGTG